MSGKEVIQIVAHGNTDCRLFTFIPPIFKEIMFLTSFGKSLILPVNDTELNSSINTQVFYDPMILFNDIDLDFVQLKHLFLQMLNVSRNVSLISNAGIKEVRENEIRRCSIKESLYDDIIIQSGIDDNDNFLEIKTKDNKVLYRHHRKSIEVVTFEVGDKNYTKLVNIIKAAVDEENFKSNDKDNTIKILGMVSHLKTELSKMYDKVIKAEVMLELTIAESLPIPTDEKMGKKRQERINTLHEFLNKKPLDKLKQTISKITQKLTSSFYTIINLDGIRKAKGKYTDLKYIGINDLTQLPPEINNELATLLSFIIDRLSKTVIKKILSERNYTKTKIVVGACRDVEFKRCQEEIKPFLTQDIVNILKTIIDLSKEGNIPKIIEEFERLKKVAKKDIFSIIQYYHFFINEEELDTPPAVTTPQHSPSEYVNFSGGSDSNTAHAAPTTDVSTAISPSISGDNVYAEHLEEYIPEKSLFGKKGSLSKIFTMVYIYLPLILDIIASPNPRAETILNDLKKFRLSNETVLSIEPYSKTYPTLSPEQTKYKNYIPKVINFLKANVNYTLTDTVLIFSELLITLILKEMLNPESNILANVLKTQEGYSGIGKRKSLRKKKRKHIKKNKSKRSRKQTKKKKSKSSNTIRKSHKGGSEGTESAERTERLETPSPQQLRRMFSQPSRQSTFAPPLRSQTNVSGTEPIIDDAINYLTGELLKVYNTDDDIFGNTEPKRKGNVKKILNYIFELN